MLRASFHEDDANEPNIIIEEIDPACILLQQQDIEEPLLAEAIRQYISLGFDLKQAPLLRAKLFNVIKKNKQNYSRLCIVAHHLIMDGESINLLINELSSLYNFYAHNKILSLPELPKQYHNYCAWENESLSSQAMLSQVAYWEQHLNDLPFAKKVFDA